MTRYHILDCAIVNASPQRLFDILTDFEHIQSCFPKNYRVRMTENRPTVVGRELILKPNPMIAIGWKIEAADPPRSFRISYSKGWHRGHGVWRFDEDQGGTRVSYEIDIVVKNHLFGFLYKLADLPKRHCRDIHQVIALLSEKAGAGSPTECSSKVFD